MVEECDDILRTADQKLNEKSIRLVAIDLE